MILSGEKIFIHFNNRIVNEFKHFDVLSTKAKRLLLSYTLQGAAYPLVSTFVNAYIWRSGENILSVALYNIGNFISLPIFFYLTGLLLKKINLKTLYFIGACLSPLSAILVIFYESFNPLSYLAYGLIYGVGFGFYWANRNYLTLKETESENRNYFIGLNFSIDTASSIIVPAATGWLLVLGQNLGWYTIEQSYKLMVLIALAMLTISGYLITKDNYETPKVTKIINLKPSKRWSGVRLLTLAIGLTEGISYFIPTLIILSFLGDEAVLGSFDSIMAIVILFINYYYGRKAKVNDQKKVFWFGLAIGLFASIIIFLLQTQISVIFFLALAYVAGNLAWVSMDPFVMDIMDNENRDNNVSDYSMVFDRELFLNLGRILSVSIVTTLLFVSNKRITLSSSYLIAYSIEIILILLFWKNITSKQSYREVNLKTNYFI